MINIIIMPEIQPIIEPSDTRRNINIVRIPIIKPIIPNGLINIMAPTPVATPLPPLNLAKIGII